METWGASKAAAEAKKAALSRLRGTALEAALEADSLTRYQRPTLEISDLEAGEQVTATFTDGATLTGIVATTPERVGGVWEFYLGRTLVCADKATVTRAVDRTWGEDLECGAGINCGGDADELVLVGSTAEEVDLRMATAQQLDAWNRH